MCSMLTILKRYDRGMLTSQQKRLCDYFEKASKAKALRHSYIIKGESGSGKKYVLGTLLKLIMCRTNDACGNCNACHTVDAGSNPDIVRVSNGEKKTIEIQKIRDLIKEVYIKPSISEYKIFVIENAHLMDAAPQNALLKVIEEPPSYAIFILLCDNLNMILQTILSRVMLLEIAPTYADELKSIMPLGEDKNFMYNYCQGNIGRLKDISQDEDFQALRNGLIGAVVEFVRSDAYGVYDISSFWDKNKASKETLMNIFILFIRDVVFFKSNLKENITNTDKINEIEAVSAAVTLKKSFAMLQEACALPRQVGKYGDLNMAVQTMFIRLKEEIND